MIETQTKKKSEVKNKLPFIRTNNGKCYSISLIKTFMLLKDSYSVELSDGTEVSFSQSSFEKYVKPYLEIINQ